MRRIIWGLIVLTACCVPDQELSPDAELRVCPAPWLRIPWATAKDVDLGDGVDWIRVSSAEFAEFAIWRQEQIACGVGPPAPEIHVIQEQDWHWILWDYAGDDGFRASMDWIKMATGRWP